MRRPLCECGCGEVTPLAVRTRTCDGHVKGKPLRFVHGHQHRLATQRLLERIETPQWIEMPGPLDTPCHVWQRFLSAKGYAQIGDGGKVKNAHRVFYERAHGPIPPRHEVHHRCENKACVNVDHLEAITPLEHHRRHPRPRKLRQPVQLVLDLDRRSA